MLGQEVVCHGRRRSVDVGGLSLALENNGLGHGWGGWDEGEMGEMGPTYAELLSDMHTHTLIAVKERHADSSRAPLSSDARSRLISSLDNWNFEPHKLPEEEAMSCTLILFESLFHVDGMQADVGVSLVAISSFLYHLRHIYRSQNSYHNFQHALDVLQAMQTFLCSAGMVPPVSILLDGDGRTWRRDTSLESGALISCLSNHDLFTLYIAAIGHDVGHPGFTNGFMKNAKTALSAVYDDKSALEHMHCTLLLHVMRYHGLGSLLDRPEHGARFRKLLLETVLVTDMSVHFEFMARWKGRIRGDDNSPPHLTKTLICQALIKCADISNPSRPHGVSKYWASALGEEWAGQSYLEKHLQLPLTVQTSGDPLSEARCQVNFINAFAKPLLELTAEAIPQMQVYAQQCAQNLALWETRYSELPAESEADQAVAPSTTLIRRPEDFATVFPLTLPSCPLGSHDDQVPVTWHHRVYTSSSAGSSSSSDGSSESGGPNSSVERPCAATPCSPLSVPVSPAESLQSFVFSPRSEYATLRPPSSAGSVNGTSKVAATAIRAAYDASVRKKKSFHRSSWSSSLISQSSMRYSDGPQVALVVSTPSGRGDKALHLPSSPTESILVGRPTRLSAELAPA